MNNQNSPSAALPTEVNRRRFIAGTGAAALSFTLLQPGSLLGAESKTKLSIGLIGCGGRGQWILKHFADHGGFNIAAVADYFEDRANAAGDKYQLPPSLRFTGLNGYRRLLEQKLDAVAIESPPLFPSGTRRHRGRRRQTRLCRQTHCRRCPRLPKHRGQRQKSHGEQTGFPGGFPDPGVPESRLRAWAIDRVLSGDIITEQNIHALDVASWILDAAPLKAYGTGGRARPFLGDCWDHFAVIYYYPNDVILSFCSRQFGKFWDDIQCRVYGTEGTIDTHYGGQVVVHCDDKYNGGLTQNIYADGVVHNVATFHESILKGNYANTTVAPSVRSNLTTILGRLAAYKNREVTWKDMLRANEKWTFDTKGLKA